MNLYALRKAHAVQRLTEIDPEWNSRFLGDWQRAGEHYGLFKFRDVPGSNEQPGEMLCTSYNDPDE